MTRGETIVERIRTRAGLGASALVGVAATFAKETTVDEPNRDIIVRATTDDVDMDQEIIVPGGADLTYWQANRSMFLDHWYDLAHHVGSMRYTSPWPSAKAQRGWIVRGHVVSGLKNPLADDLLTVAREVGIGASIGFEALECSPPTDQDPEQYRKAASVVRQWRWIELSYTALPCNVACQSMAEAADESRMAELDRLVTKGRIKRASAVSMGMPDRQTIAVTMPRRRRLIIAA